MLQTRNIIGDGFTVGETAACHSHSRVGGLIRIEHDSIGGSKGNRTFADHHITVDSSDVVVAGHILRTAHHGVGGHSIAVNARIGHISKAHLSGQHVTIGKGVAIARGNNLSNRAERQGIFASLNGIAVIDFGLGISGHRVGSGILVEGRVETLFAVVGILNGDGNGTISQTVHAIAVGGVLNVAATAAGCTAPTQSVGSLTARE